MYRQSLGKGRDLDRIGKDGGGVRANAEAISLQKPQTSTKTSGTVGAGCIHEFFPFPKGVRRDSTRYDVNQTARILGRGLGCGARRVGSSVRPALCLQSYGHAVVS